MAGIFISYKHGASSPWAMMLHAKLSAAFRDEVFIDVGAISPGELWANVIDDYLERSDVCIVAIATDFLAGDNESGGLADPENPFRTEIRTALDLGLHIVPVLISGANVPDRSDLPDDVKALAATHAFDLNAYRDVDDVIDHIQQWRARPAEGVLARAAQFTIVMPESAARTGIPQDSYVEADAATAGLLGVGVQRSTGKPLTWREVAEASDRRDQGAWVDEVEALTQAVVAGSSTRRPVLKSTFRGTTDDSFYLPSVDSAITRKGTLRLGISLRELPPETAPLPGSNLDLDLTVVPQRNSEDQMVMIWTATVSNSGNQELHRVVVTRRDDAISGDPIGLPIGERRHFRFTTEARPGQTQHESIVAKAVDPRSGTITAKAQASGWVPPIEGQIGRRWMWAIAVIALLMSTARIAWADWLADDTVSSQAEAFAIGYSGLAVGIILLTALWASYANVEQPEKKDDHEAVAVMVGAVVLAAGSVVAVLDYALGWPWPVGLSAIGLVAFATWYGGSRRIASNQELPLSTALTAAARRIRRVTS